MVKLRKTKSIATTGNTLTIGQSGGNLVVAWPVGQLQSAMNVTGSYVTITNATSPCTVPATNAQQFYRVKEN